MHSRVPWGTRVTVPLQISHRCDKGKTRLKMVKRCLVTYSSYTGNTEKVAFSIKETFERNGWQCDIFKVRKQADDILRPPFDIRSYDFVCAGSGLRAHLPYNEILNMLRGFRTGFDPRITLRFRDETIPYITEPIPELPPNRKRSPTIIKSFWVLMPRGQ